jgi:hypothetical protein
MTAMALATIAGVGYLGMRHNYEGQLPARILLKSLVSWLYLFLLGALLQLHRARALPFLRGRALWWGTAYLA